MADFPESIPVQTDLQNDVDDILAEHQNVPNDEITALATMLGALGKPQSWGIDMVSAMLNGQPPIVVKKDANTLTVKAGVCWIANSGQSIRLPRRNASDVDITASDLDTGSMADDTYYYVYAVADAVGTTMTFKFSASATTPTGLTSYELIGWFYNESAGSLDVTSGFVGNYKRNGRNVPNCVKVSAATDIVRNNTAYGDMDDMTVRFSASGSRPLVAVFEAPLSMQDDSATGAIAIDIGGSTKIFSVIYRGANGGTNERSPFTLHWFDPNVAAGQYTVKVQWKSSGSEIRQSGSAAAPRTLVVFEL